MNLCEKDIIMTSGATRVGMIIKNKPYIIIR